MHYLNKLFLSSLLLSPILISPVFSADVNGNFQSRATLNAKCNLSAENMSFGDINFIQNAATKTAQGSISLLCTKDTLVELTPNNDVGGLHTMLGQAGNPDVLKYQLLKLRSNGITWEIWRNKINPTDSIKITADGNLVTIPIQGMMLDFWLSYSNRDARPGNYSGTITVTATY